MGLVTVDWRGVVDDPKMMCKDITERSGRRKESANAEACVWPTKMNLEIGAFER